MSSFLRIISSPAAKNRRRKLFFYQTNLSYVFFIHINRLFQKDLFKPRIFGAPRMNLLYAFFTRSLNHPNHNLDDTTNQVKL